MENYRAQSSAGLSKLFLFIWLTGDVCNLVGALWAGLVPTVIALGIYFCFADAVLILQCIYYDLRNRSKTAEQHAVDTDEQQRPLLRRVSHGIENATPPGSGRRSSFKRSMDGSIEGVPKMPEERKWWRAYAINTGSVLGVCAIGTIGWAVAFGARWWKPVPISQDGEEVQKLGAQVLGYASAVFYLGFMLLSAAYENPR